MNRFEQAAEFGSAMGKQAFLAWGGGKAGLYPRGFGIGGELGYTNLMGLVPFPTAGIDIGGPRHGFNAGITSDPGSDFGVSPYLGLRIGHPRVSGLTRNFPRGLPDVLYDKARGRTRDDAFRASYPEDKFPEYYAKDEPEETASEGQEPVNDKPNKDDKTDKADKPDNKEISKAAAVTALTDMLKAAKCWTDYERVPGTAALSEGSCRPVGKKKKESEKKAESPAWQRSEGKNPDGGLNNKGRASLKAEGKNIKRPQPEGGARKDSFCARMGGMKSKLTSEATANDPDSRINKALRKWKC